MKHWSTLQFYVKVMSIPKYHLNIILNYKSLSQVPLKNNTSELKISSFETSAPT